MSLKRSIQKQIRLARPHEGPFREVVAYREAFRLLGFEPANISQRFETDTKNPNQSRERCVPLVVIEIDPGFAVSLRGFEIYGSEEQVTKLWREWVIPIIGKGQDIPEDVANEYWYKSKVSHETVEPRLVAMIEAAGIKMPERRSEA